MKKKTLAISILLLFVTIQLVVIVNEVTALPGPPMIFYGTTKDTGGKTIPDGIIVSAVVIDPISGNEWANQSILNGGYGNESTGTVFKVNNTEIGRDGYDIYFYIGGESTSYPSGAITFSAGTVELNLTIIDIPVIVSDNSPSSGNTGDTFTFNVTVTDVVDISSNLTVSVNWSHGSLSDNTTLTNSAGDFFTGDITLDLNSTSNMTYTIWANDTSGNMNSSGPSTVTVTDNDDPTSSVNSISGYWKTSSPLSISGTASDNIGLKNVTLYYYNSNDNSTFNGPYSFSVNTTPWINSNAVTWSFTFPNSTGYYRFYSIATDNSSNDEDAPSTNDTCCGYDNTSPVVTLTALSSYKNNDFTVEWSAASETSGVATWTVQYRENVTGTWTAWFTNVSYSKTSATWLISNTTENCTVYFRALAVDNATNVGSWSSNVSTTKDTTAPTSNTITSGSYWKTTSSITIYGSANDSGSGLNNVKLYHWNSSDNNTWTGPWNTATDNTPWSNISWDFNFTSTNGTGYYRFYSIATDNVSNEESITANDTLYGYGIAPITSVNSISTYWQTSSPLSITATANDYTGDIKNVTLYYHSSTDNTTFTGPYNFGVNTSPWLDSNTVSWSFTFPNSTGYYRFYSIGVDNSSNEEETPSTNDTICGYDITSPTSSVSAISPYWHNSSDQLTINGSGDDATSGLGNASLYYYNSTDNFTWNGPYYYNCDNTPWSMSWNFNFTSTNGTGYYRFYSIATDNATNSESAPSTNDTSCYYHQTNSPPNAAINPSPSDDASDQPVTTDLSWSYGGDPDGNDSENASYIVYFGTDSTPDSSEYKGDQNTTTYDPGALSNSVTYYWQIITIDNQSIGTPGSVWSFTTVAAAGDDDDDDSGGGDDDDDDSGGGTPTSPGDPITISNVKHTPTTINSTTEVNISATIIATAGVDSAKVIYTYDSVSYTIEMTLSSINNYYAMIGPFHEWSTITYYINATDENGAGANSDTYNFTVTDENKPTIILVSPGNGSSFTNRKPTIKASYSDPGGIDIDTVKIILDDVDKTNESTVTSSLVTYIPLQNLSIGRHDVIVEVSDNAGNNESINWSFTITLKQVKIIEELYLIIEGEDETILLGDYNSIFDEIILSAAGDIENLILICEKLDEKPDDVTAPSIPVYAYMEIETNAEDGSLKSITIKFKIEQKWFEEYKIDKTTIKLLRYNDGKWEELATTLLTEDSEYVYYSAVSPGLSTFAITGVEDEDGQEVDVYPFTIPIAIIVTVLAIIIIIALLFKTGYLYIVDTDKTNDIKKKSKVNKKKK